MNISNSILFREQTELHQRFYPSLQEPNLGDDYPKLYCNIAY